MKQHAENAGVATRKRLIKFGVAGLGYEGGHDAVVATQDRAGRIRATSSRHRT
jgi:hypothetical protein